MCQIPLTPEQLPAELVFQFFTANPHPVSQFGIQLLGQWADYGTGHIIYD
ncbi:MAG: hypothetical protein HN877_05965 [Rhodospirillaceae bacterium]|nr:hypothetical protein [Rhodospirillaceae bacterium]